MVDNDSQLTVVPLFVAQNLVMIVTVLPSQFVVMRVPNQSVALLSLWCFIVGKLDLHARVDIQPQVCKIV